MQLLSHNLAELQAKSVPSQDLALLIASLFFKPFLAFELIIHYLCIKYLIGLEYYVVK